MSVKKQDKHYLYDLIKKNKKEFTQFFTKTILILVFSALVVTLSLAINELFVEIKEKYISSHRGKIIANIIYIAFLISVIIGGLFTLRLFHIDINVSTLIG